MARGSEEATVNRIGFCGASGTGKSTLACWVSEKHGLEICPVGSRSVAASMGFAFPYDVDVAGKRDEFQRRLLAEKVAWEGEHESFVTDRTTLDNLAYSAMHTATSIDAAHYDGAMRAFGRYQAIFYCPVEVFCDPGEDAARVKDLTYHRLFDAVLRGLIEDARRMSSLFVVRLPGGLAERKLRIEDFLA